MNQSNRLDRRQFFAGAAVFAVPGLACGSTPIRLGITPVFADSDADTIDQLASALAEAMSRPVGIIQRRTYQEVTGLLLGGSVDAAWLCGFPFLQHQTQLSLLTAPVWRGAPRYRSYLIAGRDDDAQALADLRGGLHAFSDPDSNSGWLVTAAELARMGETADGFFRRSIFAYGHRNVVRAVAGGLARSGSVDGYVWEALARIEPALTQGTRIVAQSEQFGFPPFVCRNSDRQRPQIMDLQRALLGLTDTAAGRAALDLLQLDGMTEASPALYDGIAARMQDIAG